MDYNQMTVTGRLTSDPKRISKDGAESTVAILKYANNYRTREGGEWVDKVLYVESPVFGKMADNALQYLSKGSRILISGLASIKVWESDGKSGHTLHIMPDKLVYLETKKKSDEAPF